MNSAPPPAPDSNEPVEHALPSAPPSFGALLWANIKVLLVVALVAAAAFGTWRGLAALFPEIEWLQFPD